MGRRDLTPEAPRWTDADLLSMWQIGRVYGLREGVTLAGELVDQAVAEALAPPTGHGGPDLDAAARATALDLYRRYLLMTRRPDRAGQPT